MAEMHLKSLDYGSRAAKLERDVAGLLYEGLDTPVSLSCALLLKYGEIAQLVEKKINPASYECLERFSLDYQAVSLLSKSKLQSTGFDRKDACMKGYLKSEKLCLETNERLLRYEEGLVSPLDVRVSTVVETAQRLIARWTTPFGKRELAHIESEMGFGPGATVGVKRIVTSGRKFDINNIDCTSEVLSFGIHCLPEIWKQRVTGFNVTRHAELEFVPKNCKTDRAIEIQPTLNIYVQKGVGSWLRSRLANFGLDLSRQEPNQRLAREGSIDNSLVTADLESASDTIAHQAVRLMLTRNDSLLQMLEWCRVGSCKTKDGSTVELEKFSAMGNGYTFELESMIFYSLTLAACRILDEDETRCRVYGDDIIVPRNVWPLLRETLNFLGFSVNARKTFGNTYFRESCGADFFKGVNVRPVFFKQECTNVDDFRELCYIYSNQLLRGSTRLRDGNSRDRRYFRAWFLLFDQVAPHRRFRVPEGYEANGFLGSFDECVPSLRRDTSRGWAGYFFKYSFRPSRKTDRYAYGALISTLKSGSVGFTYGEEALRGRANRMAALTKTGYSLEWPDFGPWA